MEYNINNFPTNWDEVTLEYGKKIFTLQTSGMTDHQYLEEVIKCFDIELKNLKIEELNSLKSKCLELVSQQPNNNLETEFIIGGKRYHLIKDFKNLTFGEFLDLELIMSEEHVNIWGILDKILGVLIREVKPDPKTKFYQKPKFLFIDYNSNDVIINAEIFNKYLSVNDVYGIISFFFIKGIIYSTTILSYSKMMEEKNQQN